MIDYKTSTTDLINDNTNNNNTNSNNNNNERVSSAQFNGNFSLTNIWEIIVRTKRLPDNLNKTFLFFLLRDRLRDPEREVRQHALRVLADTIPIINRKILDKHIKYLLPELIINLSNKSPSIRKGVIDVLKIYLNCIKNPNDLIKNLLQTIPNENKLKFGIIMALPNLINHQINEETLIFILKQLFLSTKQQLLKETSLNTLIKIRRNLGTEKFNTLIGTQLQNQFQKLCHENNITIDDTNVILETEITLDTGPAITMKIHEDPESNNDSEYDDDDDDPDSELKDRFSDDIEEENFVVRSPRKVHFGGEIVKMRTPESDSNQPSDNDQNNPINSVVSNDSVFIKRKISKSRIPVRIKPISQPSTPSKAPIIKRLSKSAPDLRRHFGSKIPLRNKSKYKSLRSSTNLIERKIFSPIPIHNEIEILHNLTRTPEKPKKCEDNSDYPGGNQNNINYESFQVYPEIHDHEDDDDDEDDDKNNNSNNSTDNDQTIYPSFQIFRMEGTDKDLPPLAPILHELIHEPNFIPLPRLFDSILSLDDTNLNQIQNHNQDRIPQNYSPKLIKKIFQTESIKVILDLINKSSTKLFFNNLPSIPNENILKTLIALTRTLPSCEIDIEKGIELAVRGLRDEQRKVRQAALESLACLAQISNNTIVLNNINKLTKSNELMRIVRTRLSRRQLPTVDLDGNIKYSPPREQEELDWLCGGNRYLSDKNCDQPEFVEESNDGSSDDVTKLWSVDPLPKIDKNTTPTTTYLVPGYTFKNKEKGYKQYDRGRSNSPPNNKNKRKNFHNFHNNDNFSKSFSSEHIHQESSSSTTTSTAGSTASKEGLWFRSGIPVAINQEKLKFRHRNKQKLHHSRPMVAHPLGQKKLDSPQVAKFTSQTIPPSSGSESSGYFTPPAEHHLKDPINEQFVQEVDEEEVEEEEETDPPVSSDLIIESSADELPQYQKLQRQSSVISLNEMNEKHLEMGKIIQSQSSHDLTDNGVIVHSYDFVKTKNKSNSEINLKNFLPDIASSSHRKNISSAPPLNDLVPYNFKQTPYVVSTLLPGACIQDDQPSIPLPPPSRGKMNEPIQTNRRLQKRSFFKNPTKSTKMEKIRSYSRSKDALLQAVQQMESIDWEIIMQGLNNLKKLTRHHPDLLETQIHPICVALGKNIKNLRSQVARNACRTASELFANCKKSLEIELEELAVPLLQRTADTNKFLRSDANAALDTMCLHFSIPKVVGVITNKGSNHPNGIVRAATTRLLSEMALRLGAEKIYQLPKEIRDKFLLIGSNGLTEGSLDTRKYAKALMGVMVNHPNFHKALLETVPQTTIRHIAKIINSLKT